MHSRVPGGFSSDPVRGSTGFRQVYARHVCVLFTVLRPCRLGHSAAKWSLVASNREKHRGFHDFRLPGPTWPHMPSRCLLDAPKMAPDAPQMVSNHCLGSRAGVICLFPKGMFSHVGGRLPVVPRSTNEKWVSQFRDNSERYPSKWASFGKTSILRQDWHPGTRQYTSP